VFFNHPKGRDIIIDMFLYSPQYVFSSFYLLRILQIELLGSLYFFPVLDAR